MNIVKHPDMHEKLNVVKSKKIIFGHQSVGYNIVKGLDRIVNETGVTGFNLVESKNTMNSKGGIFAHCKKYQILLLSSKQITIVSISP